MCPPFLRIKFTAKIRDLQVCLKGHISPCEQIPKNLLFYCYTYLKKVDTFNPPPNPIRYAGKKIECPNSLFQFLANSLLLYILHQMSPLHVNKYRVLVLSVWYTALHRIYPRNNFPVIWKKGKKYLI